MQETFERRCPVCDEMLSFVIIDYIVEDFTCPACEVLSTVEVDEWWDDSGEEYLDLWLEVAEEDD